MASSRRSPIELQVRDWDLLRDLLESRVMTLRQAAILHFGGKSEAAKKRIQKLKAAKLIHERPRSPNEPSVLHLAPTGFDSLKSNGVLLTYPPFSRTTWLRRANVSQMTIAHELAVMEVRAAIVHAVRAIPNLAVTAFVTWPLLLEYKITDATGLTRFVRPDGLLRLEETSGETVLEHTFFVELDRSSESLEVLASKAAAYREHYRSGGYAVQNGGTREQFREYPFRILVVCKTAERRNNIAERLLRLDPPLLHMAMLSTLDETVADPFGSTWITPAAYRDATASTRYAIGSRPHAAYVRDGDRQRFVDSRITKHRLVEQ